MPRDCEDFVQLLEHREQLEFQQLAILHVDQFHCLKVFAASLQLLKFITAIRGSSKGEFNNFSCLQIVIIIINLR